MKKLIIIPVFVLFATFWYSCTKDKAPVFTAPTNCDSTKGYAMVVKKIMDDNCAVQGCHDASTHQSGVDLSTYVGTMNNATRAICRMDGSCGTIMPSPRDKLADSLINKVKVWQTNGFCK